MEVKGFTVIDIIFSWAIKSPSHGRAQKRGIQPARNVAGVLLWLAFIDNLATFVSSISPAHPDLQGLDKLAHETPRQIANAHTIFNIINTLVFIGFTGVFARLVEKLVPDRPLSKDHVIKPKYLEPSLINTPSMGLDRARFEVIRVGRRVLIMLDEIGPAFLAADPKRLKAIKRYGKDVNKLNAYIIDYLRKIGQSSLPENSSRQLSALVTATNNLGGIADLIDIELVSRGLERSNKNLLISDLTRKKLEQLQIGVRDSLELCIDGLEDLKKDTEKSVFSNKTMIKKLSKDARTHLLQRLQVDEPDRLDLYGLEISVIEQLLHIYYYTKQLSQHVSALAKENDEKSSDLPEVQPEY